MSGEFDVIVIGSGPGGYVCAIRAAQLGLKTACVEYEATLGGTCLNVGCIPSKALLQSSEEYSHVAHGSEKHGIIIEGMRLDLAKMMARKQDIVKSLTGGIEYLLKKNKVTWLKGRGAFASPNSITVTASGGEATTYAFKNAVIATGSKPIEIPPARYDRKNIVSSTGALKFDEVPPHLLVIGGGVIGLEMGSVWLRLGSKVTVVEALDCLLPGMDREVSKETEKVLAKQGMKFLLGTKLVATKVLKDKVVADCEKAGEKLTVDANKMLVAVGRRANTEGLEPKLANILLDGGGRIEIDDHFRTSCPNVYGIGDVIRGPMLAHKAEDEGVAVAEIIAGKFGHVNYDAIPGVVYTWPEIAVVGKTEEQLKEQGVSYSVGKFPFSANGRAKALGTTDGFVKILADATTDKVLGAHIVGPNASELISEIVVAMEFDTSAEDIARSCHAHPTLSEVTKEAALGVAKRSLHM